MSEPIHEASTGPLSREEFQAIGLLASITGAPAHLLTRAVDAGRLVAMGQAITAAGRAFALALASLSPLRLDPPGQRERIRRMHTLYRRRRK